MMANFIMVYTSMTGNTKAMADRLAEGIRKAGYDVRMEESDDFDAKELKTMTVFSLAPILGAAANCQMKC